MSTFPQMSKMSWAFFFKRAAEMSTVFSDEQPRDQMRTFFQLRKVVAHLLSRKASRMSTSYQMSKVDGHKFSSKPGCFTFETAWTQLRQVLLAEHRWARQMSTFFQTSKKLSTFFQLSKLSWALLFWWALFFRLGRTDEPFFLNEHLSLLCLPTTTVATGAHLLDEHSWARWLSIFFQMSNKDEHFFFRWATEMSTF